MDRTIRPEWAQRLFVGVDLVEPAMSYRTLAALEPYQDFEEVADHIRQIRSGLPRRTHQPR